MKKKEPWMKKGKIVRALGKLGTITKVIENTGLGYVYNFDVKLDGSKHPGRYHVADVEPIE